MAKALVMHNVAINNNKILLMLIMFISYLLFLIFQGRLWRGLLVQIAISLS